jgi:hypothetical protein
VNVEAFLERVIDRAGIPREQAGKIIEAAFQELHRQALVDEQGPTGVAQTVCYSVGGRAASHLIGFMAATLGYFGAIDDANDMDETAARLVPEDYQACIEEVRRWLPERSKQRKLLDERASKYPLVRRE